MSISRAKVESALKQHQDPYLHRDYAQLIQSVDIQGDHVKVVLAMPYPHASLASEIQQKLSQAIIKAGAKAVDCQRARSAACQASTRLRRRTTD